ncbi:hypothetical protein RIF29_09041 [Crotalaria pallida]|uniref:Uncharacterized protein n=1 Tax=Crotalaria pallida TaxID=3830 RepID=A0AAN9IJA0_CROPI
MCSNFYLKDIPTQGGETPQPQVGPSLPTQVCESQVVKAMNQLKISYIPGTRNGHKETDQIVVSVDGKVNKPIKTVHKISKKSKFQWTPYEDRVLVDSKDSWTKEEEIILIEAHKTIGNKWAEISRRLPGRTESSVKNYWNATKRRLKSKRQMKKHNKSNGELLLNYIQEVTTVVPEEELMESMRNMNIVSENDNDLGLPPTWHEIFKCDFNNEKWASQVLWSAIP